MGLQGEWRGQRMEGFLEEQHTRYVADWYGRMEDGQILLSLTSAMCW